jgi:hypothetical protein
MVAGIEMIVRKRVPEVAGVVAHSPMLPDVLDLSSE